MPEWKTESVCCEPSTLLLGLSHFNLIKSSDWEGRDEVEREVFIHKSEASHADLPQQGVWRGKAVSPTVREKPSLASQELSRVFAVRTKLIIRTGWLWLWLQGKNQIVMNGFLLILCCLDWSSRTVTAASWVLLDWPLLIHQSLTGAPSPLSTPSPIGHSSTQSLSSLQQLTFYSFSLSLYLYTSGFLVTEGSVEICYLGNYKINSSCEIFENPISAASIDWDHLNSWPVLS